MLLAASLFAPAGAADPQTPGDVFRSAQRIDTADGVDIQRYIPIGGINQYVSVRGRHRNNPILLFLHGGPGLTSIPVSYHFMAGWDDYFTLVQWDQRGAGKTWEANDPARVRPTMHIDTMVDDAAELVRWLRATFGQQRIVLMGHSWGTILGVKLIERHPEWFSAYVGMSQFVDFQKSEAMGYAATLVAARTEHNEQAVGELELLAPYPDPRHPGSNLLHLAEERRWLEHYDGDETGTHEDVVRYSPDYSSADRRARDQGQDFSTKALWPEIATVDFTHDTDFACPVIILQGRRDLTTSASLADQWLASVHAPYKKLVWFDDSAHMVFEEEPGKVLATLISEVLPLTASAPIRASRQ
jgi:pimeloyl-ACP methyl ester carboxylesterase